MSALRPLHPVHDASCVGGGRAWAADGDAVFVGGEGIRFQGFFYRFQGFTGYKVSRLKSKGKGKVSRLKSKGKGKCAALVEGTLEP